MPLAKKTAPQRQLQAKFREAVFKFGVLNAAKALKAPQYATLASDLTAITRVEDVQRSLAPKDEKNDGVAAGLDLPINKLKQHFISRISALARKHKREKLPSRTTPGSQP